MDAAHAFPDTHTSVDNGLPKAIDLSHHLNLLSRSREANSLKSLYQYMNRPGMIGLAGGMPAPEIFPFESMSAEIYEFDALAKKPPTLASSTAVQPESTTLKQPSWMSWLFGQKRTKTVTIPKTTGVRPDPMSIDLATLLQYSSAEGHPALKEFIRDFVAKVYQPAFSDWQIQLTVGATAAWNQIVFTFIERGDAILVEEWTYPGAYNAYQPLDVKMVGIPIDGEGIIPEEMDKILANWDEVKEGRKRPRILYTVPTGQNPTGATMLADRKKKVYELAVKYDILICEDEPYYFLYADPWVPQAGKKAGDALRAYDDLKNEKTGKEEFLRKLPPSYLRFDYQGRVIRMDTFSKTIAPGTRLGWFTCNALFAERLLRGCEAMISTPNGIGQAMVAKLLLDWKYDGYVRWLRGIKATYAMRRDWMCDILESVFHLEFDQKLACSEHIRWITAYERTTPGIALTIMDEKRGFKAKKPLVSFVPPSAGMFVWLGVHLESHADYERMKRNGENAGEKLIEKLWIDFAENNVLVSPGRFFDGFRGQPHERSQDIGFFRLAFSQASHDDMERAIKTMHKVLVDFFKA